jgi:hypothetical protein
VIFEKMELFVATVVGTSNSIEMVTITSCFVLRCGFRKVRRKIGETADEISEACCRMCVRGPMEVLEKNWASQHSRGY